MIICGDCIEIMRGMESNSVDTVITDPPYGLKFMGKDWDSFSSTKQTKSQVVKNLGAGMRQTTLKENIIFQEWTTEWAMECLRVAKPGATLLCFGGSRTYHRMACAIEDAGWVIKDCIMWLYGSGFPKALDISKQMDKRAGAERKVVGKHIATYDGCDRDSNKHKTIQETCVESHEWGFKEKSHGLMETVPSTEEAKQWGGWKSHGLKPAYEPIIVAMKPNDGTYVDNALKWGVSGVNIDECRVGTTGARNNGNKPAEDGYTKGQVYGKYKPTEKVDYGKGRFPANVIFDEEAGKMLDEQSGSLKKKVGLPYIYKDNKYSVDGFIPEIIPEAPSNYNDQGGASRFFYCAKASKSEKNAGVEGGNGHPTIKPLKLMEYLCRLTKTPTGGIVLDPFCGSGSTGIAAIRTGREFIGIEMDKDYCETAEARIKNEEDNECATM